MAEVAGLALGAAGLVSLFDTCVQAFSMIQNVQSYGRDYELLLTRLDVEKTLLLQWGERIGLLATNSESALRDPRLDQAPTSTAVERSLDCIRLILTDVETLRSNYGIIPNTVSTGSTNNTISVVSETRMNSYTESYRRFQAHIGLRQRNASLTRLVRWVIRDCDRFSDLIGKISGLIQGLNNLLPASDRSSEVMMQEDISLLVQDTRRLRLVEEACAESHPAWSDAASSYLGQSRADQDISLRVEEWLPHVSQLQERNSPPQLLYLSTDAMVVDATIMKEATTGTVEKLVHMCESGAMTLNARDLEGRSLLRYALMELNFNVSRFLILHGADVNSSEYDPHRGLKNSHIKFLIIKCGRFVWDHQEHLIRPASDILTLLLQSGASMDDTDSEGCSIFEEVYGGSLQRLIPLFLSARDDINLNASTKRDKTWAHPAQADGYTRFLKVCKSLYDQYGHKARAIRWLLRYGVDIEAKCETFGNSALHLVLLSARDEITQIDGLEIWKADRAHLYNVLTSLLEGGVNPEVRNRAGLTSKDVAQGLKCGETWNRAIRACGQNNDLIIADWDQWDFGDDLRKNYIFQEWWEDYYHFENWGCRPGLCTGDCPHYTDRNWRQAAIWNVRALAWEPL